MEPRTGVVDDHVPSTLTLCELHVREWRISLGPIDVWK